MKKKILFVFMAFILVLGVTGCKSKKDKDNNVNDDISINNSSDKSDNIDKLSVYDYIVYCETGNRVGGMALYGTGSYGEYYVKDSNVIGIKDYIVPPSNITDSEFNDAIKTVEEIYGETGTTIKVDGRKIIVTATKNNSIVSNLRMEDIDRMLNDSKYNCYKKY